jgi:hypothetical protein
MHFDVAISQLTFFNLAQVISYHPIPLLATLRAFILNFFSNRRCLRASLSAFTALLCRTFAFFLSNFRLKLGLGMLPLSPADVIELNR